MPNFFIALCPILRSFLQNFTIAFYDNFHTYEIDITMNFSLFSKKELVQVVPDEGWWPATYLTSSRCRCVLMKEAKTMIKAWYYCKILRSPNCVTPFIIDTKHVYFASDIAKDWTNPKNSQNMILLLSLIASMHFLQA